VNGAWSEWARISQSATCDNVTEGWYRTCSNPYPYKDGTVCQGNDFFFKNYLSVPCKRKSL